MTTAPAGPPSTNNGEASITRPSTPAIVVGALFSTAAAAAVWSGSHAGGGDPALAIGVS